MWGGAIEKKQPEVDIDFSFPELDLVIMFSNNIELLLLLLLLFF